MGVKVLVGSASIDENGTAHGGKAGDQTGKEVKTQTWYLHKKGWRVLRPVSSSIAEKMATAMKAACDNSKIGYDQWQRDTLLSEGKKVTPLYYPGSITNPCETDCSALIRVCVAYAFGRDIIGDILNGVRFSTANMVTQMIKTNQFVEMKGSKYTESSSYLKRGDVLVTKTQGHTVMVLNDGDAVVEDTMDVYGYKVRTELKKGYKGEDVKFLQNCLIEMGYPLPNYGADGDFGSETYKAVVKFQQGNVPGMIIGVVNVECWKAIEKFLGNKVASRLAFITRDLHNGDSGEDVKIMQECFVAAGYEFRKYGCDGDFGGETASVVKAFQTKEGLTVNGCFDAKTKDKLISVLKG